MDWAEEDEEVDNESFTPYPQLIPNKDGSETRISVSVFDDGKRVRVSRTIKKTVVCRPVNINIAQRRHWIKFGREENKPAGPQNDTTSIAENIIFKPMINWKAFVNEDKYEDKNRVTLKDAKIKCRICTGDHWTTKCPFKGTMAPEGEPGSMGETEDLTESIAVPVTGGQNYVPPHLRKGGSSVGDRMSGKYDRDDLATLRVTNVFYYYLLFVLTILTYFWQISETADEQDLREMFARFGHITRVFLAKDRETGKAKGFAFVSYTDRKDALQACEKMDGCEFIFFAISAKLILLRWIWSSYIKSGICT